MMALKSRSVVGRVGVGRLLMAEALEARLLLSGTVVGTDSDGDEYRILLSGPGSIESGADLESMVLADTTAGSSLRVSVAKTVGDGRVNVGGLDSGGADMGSVDIAGDLGGLNVGGLSRLTVKTLGELGEETQQFNIAGNAGTITVSERISNVAMVINGSLNRLQVGSYFERTDNSSNSQFQIDGDVGQVSFRHSLTADSAFNVAGGISQLELSGSLVDSDLATGGDVGRLSVAGGLSDNCVVNVGGDLDNLMVTKTISDAEINVAGRVQTARFSNDLIDSVLRADSVGYFSVADDLDNTCIGVNGDVTNLSVGDSHGLRLRVGGVLGMAHIRRDLDNALVSVLTDIGTLIVGQELNRSDVLAGIDIGDDFTQDATDTYSGRALINTMVVLGDMTDSSVAAGVTAGAPDYIYGDGDDTPVGNEQGIARINRLIVLGRIGSTGLAGQSYAISGADGVDLIIGGGGMFTGAPGVAVQEF